MEHELEESSAITPVNNVTLDEHSIVTLPRGHEFYPAVGATCLEDVKRIMNLVDQLEANAGITSKHAA